MAKLVKCKHCEAEIAKGVKKCPKCGGKLGLPTFVKFIIVVIIIFGMTIGCVSGCVNSVDESIKETSDSYKDINGKTSFKVNETFQNAYTKITMTEVNTNFTDYSEYLDPPAGKKYVMAKFEIENIDEESDEQYVSTLDFNAFADGVAVDEAYVGNDQYDDFSATLGKGKKAIGYVFYEVPVNAKEITIEYSASFWTEGNNIEFIVQ